MVEIIREFKVDAQIRIGIDVGGTFTHAVAVEAKTLTLLGKSKVLTTHKAKEGVALGITEALKSLLVAANIRSEQVIFIAHSTTQATNALLEGDVAKVGIIAMGEGANNWLIKQSTCLGDIVLSSDKKLTTFWKFIPSDEVNESALTAAFRELEEQGAESFVVSEAFSVDNQANEMLALRVAGELKLLATAGSDLSQLYGLASRTRTAILNAAMMPKMLESAELTEQCVKSVGIQAPLMIMRSDGGVMDIESVRRKPIYTMLSGPAAGVAAALMFLKISDGIFLEVGGTSTDISAIHNGRAQIRTAQVGGYNLLMKTLDVHTVGAAGGSLARIDNNKIAEVGPRSAHIANYQYVSFAPNLTDPEILLQSPCPGDAANHLTLKDASVSQTLCLTPTCAANLLGLVDKNDCAAGNMASINKAFDVLGKRLGRGSIDCAQEFLRRAVEKCIPTVQNLIKQRKLDKETIVLYGGGGGAAAIVPFLAKTLNMRYELAQSTDVVSAIGVALALLRDTVERQILSPSQDDVLNIRQKAINSIQDMGAASSTIDVYVEYDQQTNVLRATATGSTGVMQSKLDQKGLSSDQKLQLVADSMRLRKDQVRIEMQNEEFEVYTSELKDRGWLQLLEVFSQTKKRFRVLDRFGSIRFQAQEGQATMVDNSQAEVAMTEIANAWSKWGDAGKSLPNIVLLAGSKIIDLSGLLELDQITSLARVELERLSTTASVIILVTPSQ